MKLNVVIHRAEEGGYWAEIPALPGCVSEGDTLDEMIFKYPRSCRSMVGCGFGHIT